MASSFYGPAPPPREPQPIQLHPRQWPTHEWQIIEAEQQRLRTRSQQRDGERRRERRSPPRNRIRLQQLHHTPMSTPNSSTPCLVALPGSEFPLGITMERTPSGNSILSEPLYGIVQQENPQYSSGYFQDFEGALPIHSYARDLIPLAQNADYTFSTAKQHFPTSDSASSLTAIPISTSFPASTSISASASIPIRISTPINNFTPMTDHLAALAVAHHLRRPSPSHNTHERILRSIISSSSPSPPDDDTLSSILTSADALFFQSSLRSRVRFEWSSQARYRTDLIGTTALRPAPQGGFETLVVLSEPILKHEAYDWRLLISAFLHELVHCYLFVKCGFEARVEGGHTAGFRQIVALISEWIGDGDVLRLRCVRANLNEFRKRPVVGGTYDRDRCSDESPALHLERNRSGGMSGHPSCTHTHLVDEDQYQHRGWTALDDRVRPGGWR